MDLDSPLRIVCPVGGLVLFAGAQMHSTVPNTSGRTRFSIDFRTVNRLDLEDGRGAHNIDTYSQGTSLRDFVRGSDGAAMSDELISRYDSGDIPKDAVLVFKPSESAPSA
jgi:hypothetical protein